MKTSTLSLLASLGTGIAFAGVMFFVTHDVETFVNILIGTAIGSCLGVLYLSGKLPLMKRVHEEADMFLLLLGYVFIVLGAVIGVDALTLGIATLKTELLTSTFIVAGATLLLYVGGRTKKIESYLKSSRV